VEHVAAKLDISERFACKVLDQHRSRQRKVPRTTDDEVALTADITALARQYGRYGYRRITALLRAAGWRCEGLKVPARQPKRGRLWLNDGSCVRLRPERANHVWAELPKVSPAKQVERQWRAMTSSRTAPGTGARSAC
jgi:putative transposase